MPWYRQSLAQQPVTVIRTVNTTTTIAAFGSADNFTTPSTEFGDDETIMVAGTLTTVGNANLTGIPMDIYVDGGFVASTNLYGFDGVTNYYQYNIGMLVEGSHTVEARFRRTRI